MSVTIDDQLLPADSMGMATLGDVLTHVSRGKRLVVAVTIDGREPDLGSVDQLRGQSIAGRAVMVETVDPTQIADDICRDVETLLVEAEQMRVGAIDHLARGEQVDAFRKLGACFNAWGHSQDSVQKLGRLMRLDLDRIQLDGVSLAEWLTQFATQLADIRTALEARDFVQLSDILSYEADRTNQRWQAAIEAIRAVAK